MNKGKWRKLYEILSHYEDQLPMADRYTHLRVPEFGMHTI